MLHRILLIATLAFALVTPMLTMANDSIARVGTGGLTLVKSQDIRMLEEELEISTKKIRVRYRFLNDTNHDLREVVAFPMPAYGWNSGFSAYDENVRPLASFKVSVNGKPVSIKKQLRAVIGEVDVTEHLRKIGLTESQIFVTFGDCHSDTGTIECGLSKSQVEMVSLLAEKNVPYPPWEVAETAYWEQIFPAGREIVVIHEYAPFVGGVYSYPFQSSRFVDRTSLGSARAGNPAEACVADDVQQVIDQRIKKLADQGASTVSLWLNDVEYILGTGRNWKGSIKHFKLKIIKDTPERLVSLRFPSKAIRTSPTTLEFSHQNFVPQDKLIVYFYEVRGERQ